MSYTMQQILLMNRTYIGYYYCFKFCFKEHYIFEPYKKTHSTLLLLKTFDEYYVFSMMIITWNVRGMTLSM